MLSGLSVHMSGDVGLLLKRPKARESKCVPLLCVNGSDSSSRRLQAGYGDAQSITVVAGHFPATVIPLAFLAH